MELQLDCNFALVCIVDGVRYQVEGNLLESNLVADQVRGYIFRSKSFRIDFEVNILHLSFHRHHLLDLLQAFLNIEFGRNFPEGALTDLMPIMKVPQVVDHNVGQVFSHSNLLTKRVDFFILWIIGLKLF